MTFITEVKSKQRRLSLFPC